ncbi:MAG: hypothetical protein LQ344_005161 [Seirophora lacunosa]|nr:MAG: hypothetical protein LQ344_005161 [Seirophora lacunosa]
MQVTRLAPTALRSTVRPRAPIETSPCRLRNPYVQSCGIRPWKASAPFSHLARLSVEGRLTGAAKEPRERSDDAQASDLDEAVAQEKEKQTRAPWHREGSATPPVARQRSAGAMVKARLIVASPLGKLLTTPSRLLKLIIPLTTIDQNSDRKDVEPLALLVHPQQPLSYLERLIQSELPTITNARGEEKIPAVHFRAEDSPQDEILSDKRKAGNEEENNDEDSPSPDADLETSRIDGKTESTGKLNRKKKTTEVAKEEEAASSQHLGEGSVEQYSGLGHEGPTTSDTSKTFVRWSPSTEIGDFIRDAARGKEFAIEIEGSAPEGGIRIGVPSFNDRTHYLRSRLRKTSTKIMQMAEVKRECDMAAHKGAQRVAIGGAGLLVGYWYIVYRLTFETDLGWDTMEPVTYLVGLSTLICGYLWFLYHNREVSYRAALNLTISRRQTKLYTQRGFDLQRWEALVDEGNALRREIKQIASEYDVEWDERGDEKDEKVTQALKSVRDSRKEGRGGKKGKKGGKKGGEEEEDEEED